MRINRTAGIKPSERQKMPVVSAKYSDINANKATLVIGAPGTGKSWCVVRTEILQALKRNGSLVVSDPKGELYTSMSYLCRKKGWNVKVLNLIDSDLSNAWNVLMEVIDHETGMLDSDRLANFATVYVRNIRPTQEDDFWQDGAKAVLMAFVGMRAYKHEQFVMSTLLQAVEAMFREKNEYDQWEALPKERKMTYITTVNEVKDLFRTICRKYGIPEDDISNIIRTAETNAPEISLGAVYYDVLSLEAEGMKTMRKEIEQIPYDHVAWASFKTFDIEGISDNVRASTLQTIALNLSIFASGTRRKMLSNNDINLWETSTRPCAYFVIADQTEAIRPILSLFFNFLFNDCAYVWDKTDAVCRNKGIDTLTRLHPVSVIMDEFYTLGYIPEFPQFLSKARSRHVDIMIVLQYITQLSELYGQQGISAISANCEYILYLGCNDMDTCKYISDFVAGGETTVMSQTHRETLRAIAAPVREITVAEAKRPLITVGEVREYGSDGSILVAKRATKPLDLKRYAYTEHPMAAELKDITIQDTVRPLSRRFKRDIFRRKYEEEYLKIDHEDDRTLQMHIMNWILNSLRESAEGRARLQGYSDIQDITDFEGFQNQLRPANDQVPEQTKEAVQPASGKKTKKPSQAKGRPVVDGSFRNNKQVEKRRTKKENSGETGNPADSSELNEL